MAERARKKGDAEEEVRRGKKARESALEKLKARDEMPEANAMDVSSLESHAALLSDAWLSRPANTEQKARIVSQLQQNYGNAYVQRVVGRIQAKRNKEPSEDKLGTDTLRRIASEKGSGHRLEARVRSEMNQAFGQDFGEVRIHTGGQAEKSAEELGARAFTSGKDIFFGEGQYDPTSSRGKELLGHELAHVVQQDSDAINAQDPLVDSKDSFEAEADAVGRAVVDGTSISLGPAPDVSPLQLQKVEPEVDKKPPKTTKDPKEILGKVLEAGMKTEIGKKVTDKLQEAATSEEGIAILSMLAVPTLATMFAEKMEVPQFAIDIVPKFAKIELGKDIELAFQPIYRGKFGEKPKEWGGMVTFTIKRW